jgi:hypothetical protein
MRAVFRSAWSKCACNLHWLMQAAAIQGAVSLRVNQYLTLERKRTFKIFVLRPAGTSDSWAWLWPPILT